jgi:serine/threonine protein kinase/peptidoglycan hydrolase-like protein with peptidoglycan-binding domain
MVEAGTDQASIAHERDLMALPLGTVVSRYRITAILGRGGFGITYRAHDAKLDREVAIKEYLPATFAVRHGGSAVLPSSTKWAEDFARGRQRFLDEGRTLASLQRTPAIVQVYDYLEANSTAYIVMGLVPGITLEARLRQTPTLPASEVDGILWPLLDGLQRVHEAGFLHRDIKPGNIILGASGEPTLIDFGASRAAMIGSSAPLTVIYTPGYAAAEQFSAAEQGPWTDIYGLAATLYQAITGDRPASAVDRVLEDTHRPLAARQPAGFPHALLLGIDAGLAMRARDRPQSIAAWRSMLQGRSPAGRDDTIPLGHRPVPAARSEVADKRRRQTVWVGIGALILLAAGGGYYAWTTDRPTSVGAAAQRLTVEELTQALEERRKADAAAVEKKRLEEEAERKAEADAEAKRQADAALEKARQERQRAEEELAALKAGLEARQKAEAQQREQAAAATQRALEEAAQRKAEAEIAALRKAESEAQAKAAADAAAKQRADEEAQRRAEAEAAASRLAEAEARRKADAEAETKRQADEALAQAQAERQRADEEARRRAEEEAKRKAEADARTRAEAEAKVQADAEAQRKAAAEAKAKADLEAQKKAAELAETALRLAPTDRQRVQVALNALGFDTGGSDGVFGPRSRDTIMAWQKARSLPATGFLSGPQLQALLKEAASAVARFDDDQRKIEEQRKADQEARKKADEEAKTKVATAGAQPAARASMPSDTTAPRDPRLFDGPWKRDRTARCQQAPDTVSFNGVTVRDGRFSYTSIGEHHQETCTVQINPDGSFQNHTCLLQMEGRFSGDLLQLSYLSPSYGPCTVSARRGE